MQRQSLGSPISKLHIHGGAAVVVAREDAPLTEDTKRRDSFSASDEERKLHRLSTSPLSPPKPDKFVHLIPLLTFICFLVLYLCSHSPSQTDLVQFNGFRRSPKRIDDPIEAIEDIGQLQKNHVVAIRSLTNLQETKRPSPRKLGDF